MAQDTTSGRSGLKEAMGSIETHNHHEFVGDGANHGAPLEDDPHRAAIDDNPEKPAKPTAATILAVFVSTISSGDRVCARFRKPTFDLVLGHVPSCTHLKWVPYCDFDPRSDRYRSRKHDQHRLDCLWLVYRVICRVWSRGSSQ